MSTQSTTQAVATQDNGPGALVQRYHQDFATVLPSHVKPETWVRLAQGVLRRDAQLARVAAGNPGSFLAALFDAARQGLDPGTEQFYLVSFGNEVTGIRGYQGEIELMYRAGAISSVIVEVVREHDKFSYSPGRDERPVHEIDWDSEDRGDLRLVYAYAVMKDGATSKVVVLNRKHIADAKASSRGSDRSSSPWKKHEEAMWMKTAAHRLAKWVPTSAEYIREQLRAQRDVAAETPAAVAPTRLEQDAGAHPTEDHPGDAVVYDGEVLDPEDYTGAPDPWSDEDLAR